MKLWWFRYWYKGPACLIIHMRAGNHIHLGFDFEWCPWELNLFIIWFTIQILSRVRGKDRQQYDELHEEENPDLYGKKNDS